ncbi:MAG TPA: UDP-N-acetylmuramate--L-alanine ligase [Candidatus Dormibacteraeota bacterium]|jgi:UDP-N-acetylmuramate--alanine ligase|nr:UDP-N-acetylmuramate--L-alanine ligase [Candidatus Dormibacteraeota bacterium]
MSRIHLIGIGGSGVSGLARVLLARGHSVSGCDVRSSATTEELSAEGATISLGHDGGHVAGQDLIVYSGAVRGGSPELEAARNGGVRVLTRAEMLAELMADSTAVAVAGTHGKTTVTYMLGHILTAAGWDPTVLVGDGASSRAGRSRWLVAEADESDGTLTLHHPTHALLTNLEMDHADHFGSVVEIEDLFQRFLDGVAEEGIVTICADDPALVALGIRSQRVTYGFASESDYRCEAEDERVGTPGVSWAFSLEKRGRLLGSLALRVPGRHNIQNACGAAAMAMELGVDFEQVRGALASFPGAHRRLEKLGAWGGMTLYEDYGHHPTEVRATLEAARHLSAGQLVVVFQPHRFSRLAALIGDFATAFTGADRTLVTEVYPAGEENLWGVGGRELADRIPGGRFAPGQAEILGQLESMIDPPGVVLFMGAGDIGKVGRELANRG